MVTATAGLPTRLDLYCRHCDRITTADWHRLLPPGSADSRRLCEYLCGRCGRVHCLSCDDILPQGTSVSVRDYSTTGRFRIGESIRHATFDREGTIVGKEAGTPARIIVSFGARKSAMRRLVENLC